MKCLFVFVITAFTVTIYSQFEGIVLQGAAYNQNQHFLFSSAEDTIINGSWAQIANYPQSLFGVNCYFWPETGKIFTCGGATALGVRQKACYWYDPSSNSYSAADSLPKGRWSGKLVRVKDSLYLVGSVDSFTVPDGIIYKYSPSQNHWVIKDTMPSPFIHEPSVCVFNDSLIICIGGSTNSFSGTSNIIRVYNPRKNIWLSAANFPVNNTTGHAECRSTDSTIVLAGGYGATFNNIIYHGKIDYYQFAHDTIPDSIHINWTASATNDTTIFHAGVYRVGGGNAGEWMLFGPALRNSSTYNTIYTVGFDRAENMYWRRLVPNIPDSAGNRPSLAVQYDIDSVRIYIFSGSVGLTTVQSAYKFTYAQPEPIGMKRLAGTTPKEFRLYQNYPNPFNPVTRIKFDIRNPEYENVSIVIYDVLGREAESLVNEKLKAGSYEVSWNAANHPSGVYFYYLRAGEYSASRKMILIK